jgi:hypothetical protein
MFVYGFSIKVQEVMMKLSFKRQINMRTMTMKFQILTN